MDKAFGTEWKNKKIVGKTNRKQCENDDLTDKWQIVPKLHRHSFNSCAEYLIVRDFGNVRFFRRFLLLLLFWKRKNLSQKRTSKHSK